MSNNFNEYNCWDEWDEVDYGDTWDEYDNYTEWDEDDSPDHSDCYGYGVYSECRVEDSYDDSDIPPYVPGKQRLLDIATSHFQVDNYIFTYVIFDKSTNVMIAVTNQEEAFAKVTPVSAVEEINGEYYVDSAASVTFTEMERTTASISWSSFNTSLGRVILLTQDNSETCTRPSTPFSNSTKAP